jgi:hypothetical protein
MTNRAVRPAKTAGPELMENVTKSGRLARAFWGTAALLLLSVIPLGIWVYVSWGDRELAEAIAEADRTDSGWRLEELQSRRGTVPDSVNAARVVEKVVSLLPPGWPSAALLNESGRAQKGNGRI